MNLLAIDFGGTRIRAARYRQDDQGMLIQETRAETLTLSHESQAAVIARVLAVGEEARGAGAIDAVGAAAPGPLNSARGIIYHAHTLPGWANVPLAGILSDHFGVPAVIENDGNLAALAEATLGAGIGCDPLVFMTISTGIGGGAILNGRLFTGWSGLAVEPGHMQFVDAEGQVRRLEELASGTALGRIATARVRGYAGESLLKAIPVLDGAAVSMAAMAGDALALAIVREAGQFLGWAVVNLLHLFSPEAVILGGSVTKLGDLLLEPMRAAIHARVLDPAFIPPNLLRFAACDEDVCLVGAALHARRTFLSLKGR